jgi:hypothetical protein
MLCQFQTLHKTFHESFLNNDPTPLLPLTFLCSFNSKTEANLKKKKKPPKYPVWAPVSFLAFRKRDQKTFQNNMVTLSTIEINFD